MGKKHASQYANFGSLPKTPPLEDVFVCKYMTFFQYYKQFTEKNSTTGNILSYIQPFDPINY